MRPGELILLPLPLLPLQKLALNIIYISDPLIQYVIYILYYLKNKTFKII